MQLHPPTMALVEDAHIARASLHNPLPVTLHAYVWPFVVLWPALAAIYFSQAGYDRFVQAEEWAAVYAGTIATLQSLLWLMTHWDVGLKAAFTTVNARSVFSAKFIKVVPVKNSGSAEICEIRRESGLNVDDALVSFLFQKRRFVFDKERQCFGPLMYALDEEPKPFIGKFQESKGIRSKKEYEQTLHRFGYNQFDIPVPTFTELFKEHAVAPFFVFQVFCVALWMLDEYWYYSLFTLFMLVVFESTVVWQRQRTLNEFRGMSIKPYSVWTFRHGQWTEVMSDKLLPGDLVSLDRTKEDSGVACDMLLTEGTAIVNEAMLSGESTPVLKESIKLRPSDARIDPEGYDKSAMVFGGTKVLQVSRTSVAEGGDTGHSSIPEAPDKGARALVIKTGFETSQGSLMRTMMYSTERMSANNLEALLFILFLLMFAIAASWYVWTEGVRKERKRSKLMLDCILIITSVVPPELPMELSLAVNTSLAALSKYAIFCVEPFRIPYAGRVDIACFDKTGTLTGEDLLVDGVAGLDQKSASDVSSITPVQQVPKTTTLVLASAHALVRLDDGEIVGEPMERATLKSLGWVLDNNDTLKSAQSSNLSINVKRRFQFSSALKRMSSVSVVSTENSQTGKRSKSTLAAVKGAPETIQAMLVSVPENYERTYKHFTRNGARVLALAYKSMSADAELSQGKINDLTRETVESDLMFAGFLILQCPLKDDAKKAIRMLNESSHRSIMITGDNPLTAVHVAREVEIVDRDCLILDTPEGGPTDKLCWKSVDDSVNIAVDTSAPLDGEILKTKDICVTGYALNLLQAKPAWNQILEHAWVYARVSPKQKEQILLGMKELGYYTLMCGDGTNDVGALKQAHIGVALLNGTQETLDKIAETFRITKMQEIYQKQCDIMKRFNQPQPPVPVQIAYLYPPGASNPHYSKSLEAENNKRARLGQKKLEAQAAMETVTTPGAQALQASQTPEERRRTQASANAHEMSGKLADSLLGGMEDENEAPTLKLGDASVAAPFTSKLANVVAIPNIIRQGRCTLVATIQMYKILALNCLISAYSLSVIYLDGIKFGDRQFTIQSVLLSVCFLSISRAKPVEKLSKERPQPNIFNVYIIGSVLGQFAIHIATLMYVSNYAQIYSPKDETFNPDDTEHKFSPSLLNSGIYLLQLIQQVSTFAINYQGRPFRESIQENKGMYYGILLVTFVAFSCATEFIPEINEQMELVDFSLDFKYRLVGAMILDFVGGWVIEKGLKLTFSDYKAKKIAERRPDQLSRERAREAEEAREAASKKNA